VVYVTGFAAACKLSDTVDVTVNVVDVNDNSPVFTRSEYIGRKSVQHTYHSHSLSAAHYSVEVSQVFYNT